MNMPRRFIAGAVCPKCAEMDRIVMYTNEDGQFRECVSCGYKDRMGDAEPAPEELVTRVNQVPAPLPADVQPLRFVPKPPSR